MISGIWYTTQSENITSPPNNNELPSRSMHTTLETYLWFQSITNYEGDKVDLRDGVGADVGDDGDADGETPSYSKEELVVTMVSISPRRRPRSSRICPFPEKEKTFASAAASVNLGKIIA
jgi:hypothetical protein